jgi:hypothetical protein
MLSSRRPLGKLAGGRTRYALRLGSPFRAVCACEVRVMPEFRRAAFSQRKNDLWHWHPDCPAFPKDGAAIRKDKPFDEDLCARCAGLDERGPR